MSEFPEAKMRGVVYLMCTSDELWESFDRCHQIRFICEVYGLHFCRTYDYVFKARKGIIQLTCEEDIPADKLTELLNGVRVVREAEHGHV